MINVFEHLRLLGLGHLYNWVMENNSGGLNPYHGNLHIERVTEFALIGATFHDLSFREHQMIAAAALLHDINHTGGTAKSDDDNIKLALDALEIYFAEHNDKLGFTKSEIETVANSIRATRFPYELKGNDLTLIQKILRDSDVVQGPYCQSYLTSIVRGLCIEMKVPMAKGLEMQVGFYNSLKFETSWAEDLMAKALPNVIVLCDTMKSLIAAK